MRLGIMQISTHIRTRLCRSIFFITIPKHFFCILSNVDIDGEKDCP